MSKKLVYLQPVPVRIWHWLNALGIVTLIISGAQIRFPEYVPILGSYRAAINLHNTAGIVVALSFSIWFFYYKMLAHTLEKTYVPNTEDLTTGLFRQAVFYFLMYFFGTPNPHHPTPEHKFNPLQKSAYLLIMFLLMPLVSLTGICPDEHRADAGTGPHGRRHEATLHAALPPGLLALRLPLHPCLSGDPGQIPDGIYQADVDRVGRGG